MASISPIWVKISDFGISKRWGGTVLRTMCGTPAYKAPELLGLLPKILRPEGQIYSRSVDIWALGGITHQVLTSEIPFIEISELVERSTGESTYYSMDVSSSIDGELLLDYCAGRVPFPDANLNAHGASDTAIDFVKSLMVADPTKRISATDALQSAWLAEIAVSSGLPDPVVKFRPTVNEASKQPSSPVLPVSHVIVPATAALSQSQIPSSASRSPVPVGQPTGWASHGQTASRSSPSQLPLQSPQILAQLTAVVEGRNSGHSLHDMQRYHTLPPPDNRGRRISSRSPRPRETYNTAATSQGRETYNNAPYLQYRQMYPRSPRPQDQGTDNPAPSQFNDSCNSAYVETPRIIFILYIASPIDSFDC